MTPHEVTSKAQGFMFSITPRAVPHGVCAAAHFDPLAFTPALFDDFGIVCPPHIQNAVRKRQADFLAGRLIAMAAMGQAIPISIGANRQPVWPQGISGSITHSSGRCAAIVTDDALLCGVDLEKIASGSALEAILQKCLSDREKAFIASQNDMTTEALATLVFSAKECVYKALSATVGRFFGFECAEIVHLDPEGVVAIRLTENLHASLPKGFEMAVAYDIADGFVFTRLYIRQSALMI